MNGAQARALLFQRKLAYEDYEASIPGVRELDGQLGILELRASDATHAEKLAKTEQGKDEDILLGGIVAKALVLRETKERIFSDTDIQGVADFGLSVLRPIADRIKAVSGLSPDAFQTIKKTSERLPSSSLDSSSTGSLEPPVQA